MNTSHEQRDRIARQAFKNLGQSPSRKAELTVQCDSSHHLAGVYATDVGLVFHSVLHARARGRRDYADVGHHASRLGLDWFDLLDPPADAGVPDELSAGCECGPYPLSRALLPQQIAAGAKTVIVP